VSQNKVKCVKESPESRDPNQKPLLYTLTCKTLKRAVFRHPAWITLRSGCCWAKKPTESRRQESLLLTILRACDCDRVCVCVFVCVRECRRDCECVSEVRSVKEFIVCSPPVIILVPINLLASLEPVAIWKHCSVYKLGKDQHSGALTSHTNLETIRARQSGWLLQKGPSVDPTDGCGDARPLLGENANSVLHRRSKKIAQLSHKHHFRAVFAFFFRLVFSVFWDAWPFCYFVFLFSRPPPQTNKQMQCIDIIFFASLHGTTRFYFRKRAPVTTVKKSQFRKKLLKETMKGK